MELCHREQGHHSEEDSEAQCHLLPQEECSEADLLEGFSEDHPRQLRSLRVRQPSMLGHLLPEGFREAEEDEEVFVEEEVVIDELNRDLTGLLKPNLYLRITDAK